MGTRQTQRRAAIRTENFQQFLLQDGRCKRDNTSEADVPQ